MARRFHDTLDSLGIVLTATVDFGEHEIGITRPLPGPMLLVRNALKEREANLPPRSFRQLFQLLSSTIPDDTD